MTISSNKSEVFVGMSGGVDSSVAALLLQRQGYEVIGVFMQNFNPERLQGCCPWEDDMRDARRVCAKLDLPFHVVNFEKEYEKKVLEYFFTTYKKGLTPNPDILCNSEIKFKVFLDYAEKLGAGAIGTGHYASVLAKKSIYELHKGIDQTKDQSYFLHQLTQKQLSKSMFPLGDLTKKEVRAIAKKEELHNWDRKDSQGICFIGKVSLREFLSQRLRPKKGNVVTTDGDILGEHDGVWFYTIGQRHGIGSTGGGIPWYVVSKNVKRNELMVAKGSWDDALFKKELIIADMHWISGTVPKLPLHCTVKIRYRQPDQKVTVRQGTKKNLLELHFQEKQRAITPGQYAVLYNGEKCLGGGVIT